MDDNKKYWERMAKLYAPIQEKQNTKLYQAVADHVKPYLGKEKRVLELACGTGQLTRLLCGEAGFWEATDFSEKMVEETKKRGIAAHFSVQDATNLPYEDGAFDVVLIANALHIMPEPEKALSEIHRVLKPGGVLLAPTFVYEGRRPRLRLAVLKLSGFKTFSEWKADDFCRVLEKAGFSVRERVVLDALPLPELFAAAVKPSC